MYVFTNSRLYVSEYINMYILSYETLFQFFSKKGVPDVKSDKEIFSYITSFDSVVHNTAILERLHMKGTPAHKVEMAQTAPEENKPLVFPFEYAWERAAEQRLSQEQDLKESEGQNNTSE